MTADHRLSGGSERRPICLRTEFRQTLILAGPIVLNQVGHMAMGMVDTLVAGRIGTTTLAGLGLGANFFWTFTSVCMGVLLALDTFFSQSVGAGDKAGLARYLGQSWWSSIIMTVAAFACVLAGTAAYVAFAPPSEIRTAFSVYTLNVTWCVPTLFVFFVLQRYWQARHCVLPFTWIILGANVLNLLANLALGLGYWGFPRWEIKGVAYASVFSRYAMLAAAIVFTLWKLEKPGFTFPRLDCALQRSIFRLGLPAAGHTALEVSAFTIATFVVGVLGAVPLAAHHICLMMAAFTFMFPLGFSAAAAVRVGTYIGRGDPHRARLAGWLCIGISMLVMSLFAAAYLSFPRLLLGWFTQDAAVIEVGTKILLLVALFQIADGIQVSTTGALRGIGNTHFAMVANLVGHYPVGLLLGLILAFPAGLGAVGMWCGLAAGLISVAIMLITAWHRKTTDLERLQVLAAVVARH